MKNKYVVALLVCSALVLLAGYLVTTGQCPADYTQQQIDDTGCSIGADIGASMLGLVGLVGLVITIIIWLVKRKRS